MTATDDDFLLISVVQQRGREMGRGESGFCQMGGRSGPGQPSRPPPLPLPPSTQTGSQRKLFNVTPEPAEEKGPEYWPFLGNVKGRQ